MAAQLRPPTDSRSHDQNVDRDRITNNLLVKAACQHGKERHRLIDEAVLLNLNLADSVARRYSNRGIDHDDLTQVANLGLVAAAHRFDPNLGKSFASFAVPTITGEVKRYFRDHGWAVRPPRRVQELNAAVRGASPRLAQTLGAEPTPADLADHLSVEVDNVLEAGASHHCFTTASIDDRGNGGVEKSLADSLGNEDGGFARAEAVVALAPACRDLRARDRHILFLRFFHGWTQQEIAQDLGVTQMQVSRLLARILRHLRAKLGVPEPENRSRTTGKTQGRVERRV